MTTYNKRRYVFALVLFGIIGWGCSGDDNTGSTTQGQGSQAGTNTGEGARPNTGGDVSVGGTGGEGNAPSCFENGDSCATNADCCSAYCDATDVCNDFVPPTGGTGGSSGQGATGGSSGSGGTAGTPSGGNAGTGGSSQCEINGSSCSDNPDCCSGYCDLGFICDDYVPPTGGTGGQAGSGGSSGQGATGGSSDSGGTAGTPSGGNAGTGGSTTVTGGTGGCSEWGLCSQHSDCCSGYCDP
ncbi:hypothetical protein GF380_06045, partial [Candidatus Uhrbacteria bacterium]|nr:hypothetical protein [Candidatus Uhrbacteria bacterium]MBD3284539.1 hypothetical protein [Candidatus Uhrbacteria bacterium]